MPADLSHVEAIFNEAVEIRSPQERAAFLDRACGDDVDLRQRVESLLAAHDGTADVLRLPHSDRTLEPTPLSEGAGSKIGRYRLLEQIGEGGFGVVFMAEQQHPVRRKVALKIIKFGMDTKLVIARFEAERQALALMDHENIARVLDAGATESGRPYFVMELVHGVPITEYCDKNELPPRERLELFLQVCRAVQHAHTKGIIHRDIKPTNVLVTLHEGVAVPKVIDFGVSKATGQQLTEKTLFTNFAQMIGTPLYMSPEQAEMTSADVDTRSDIYSLGVLLYELLTGTTPLDQDRLKQAAFDEVRRIIREEEPPRPSTRLSTLGEQAKTISARRKSDPKQLGQFIRGELDWIVMKALEKDRRRRYETANGFARDIERYLRNDPVEACPPSASYRFRKFARRNRGPLATAGLLALVLVLASVISTWEALRATHAEREVSRERDQVQAALVQKQDALAQSTRSERGAREQLAEQLIAVGDAALASGRSAARDNYREARDIARELGNSPFPADMGLLASYDAQPAPLMGSDGRGGGAGGFQGHTKLANVAFMADGRHAVSTGGDGSIIVWDVARGMPLRKFPGVGQHTRSIAVAPDGRRLLTADSDSNLRLWDLASGELVRTFVGHLGPVVSVAFSPDGQRALSGADDDKALRLWNVETGQEVLRMDAALLYVVAVAFSPDGRRALSGGDAGAIALWDLETGRAIHQMNDGSGSDVSSVCISPDGQTALSASFNHILLLWNLVDGKPLRTFNGHPAPIGSVQFSPDGRTALSGCDDRAVRLWDVATGRQIGVWHGHQGLVRSVSFSADGRMGLTGDSSGAVKLWDLRDPRETAGFRGHTHRVRNLAASTDDRLLLSGSRDQTVRLWDIATGLPLLTLDAGQMVWGVALAPDCRSALSSHEDGTLALWDLRTASRLRTLEKHDGVANSVAFSPDGKTALSSGRDATLKLWDLQHGTVIRTLTGHTDYVPHAVFSSDGRTALSASRDTTLKLWDLETGQVRRTFTGHWHWVECMSFSPNGQWIASGGYDRQWALWDVATGRNIFLKEAGADVVMAVAFSPDGKLLATASREANIGIGLWDLTSGTHVRDLYHVQQPFEAALNVSPPGAPFGLDPGLTSLAFLRDGVTLLAGERNGTIRRWQLDRPARFDEFAKSLPQARETLERDPNNAAALAVFGQWYAFRGVYDWAAEFLEKAREHGADVSSLELARLYWQLGRHADAAREFDRAIEKKEAPQDYLELCRSAVQNAAPVKERQASARTPSTTALAAPTSRPS